MRSIILRRALLCLLAMMIAGVASAAAQTLQLFGTWRLNSEKSILTGPPPRSPTVVFQPAGADAVFAIEETTYADGTHTAIEYTAKTDSLDYPISGSPEILARADRISMKRRDAATILWSYRKGATLVLSLPGSLSADGRTLTMMTADRKVVLVNER